MKSLPSINKPLIDLHTHTTASDGVLSPEALIARAVDNGVNLLAITDHDTVAGYLSATHTLPNDFRLLSGVEISTVWQRMSIHIVGLNFDPQHAVMQALLRNQARSRNKRAKRICEKLTHKNMPIELAELFDLAGGSQIGRPHIAQAMVKKGYVKNTGVAFKKYLGAGKLGDVKSGWVSVAEAVAVIKQSGGVAVLAHPNHYRMTRVKLLALIDDFQQAGGQGIEVISGKQPQNITAQIAHLARDCGLYASIGSDFHQPLSYAADVGRLGKLPDDLQPITALFG